MKLDMIISELTKLMEAININECPENENLKKQSIWLKKYLRNNKKVKGIKISTPKQVF